MTANVQPFYSEHYSKPEILQILSFLDSPVGGKVLKELDYLVLHYQNVISNAAMSMTVENKEEKNHLIIAAKETLAQLIMIRHKFNIASLDEVYSKMTEQVAVPQD